MTIIPSENKLRIRSFFENSGYDIHSLFFPKGMCLYLDRRLSRRSFSDQDKYRILGVLCVFAVKNRRCVLREPCESRGVTLFLQLICRTRHSYQDPEN